MNDGALPAPALFRASPMNMQPCFSPPDWLELPPHDDAPWTAVSLQYGAGKVAAQYCGLARVPARIRGHWSHGWKPPHLLVDPVFVAGETIGGPGAELLWTGTEAEAVYLRANDYQARAIGLPIAYLPDRTYQRRPGTLLVMPAHSLEYTRHQWRFREYVEEIAAIRSEFETVVICIHPACIKNGYWIGDFKAHGFPIVEGAHPDDRNALERIRALTSQFEFVTTNSFGSLLAYSSAFGAKASIYGGFCEPHLADYEEDYFYTENPGVLEKVLPRLTEAATRAALPEFFCHPARAEERSAWGRQQIGRDIRLAPGELTRCFEWGRMTPWLRAARRRLRSAAARCVPARLKHQIKVSLDPRRRAFEAEVARLLRHPPMVAGECRLHGEQFHFADAATFLGTYQTIFLNRSYDFPCVRNAPTIIDCGANIGLAVRFWLQKYPDARITAFEPDPALFALLQKNCRHLSQDRLDLHEAAVWKSDGTAGFRGTGLETGHLEAVGRNVPGRALQVRTVRLAGLLDEPVDFLKIDVEGSETEVLLDCAAKLENVRRIYVEFHSFLGEPQRLGEILELFARAGFRFHLVTTEFAPRPLVELPASYGMDQRVDVWAYRGSRFPRTFVP